MNLCIVMMTLYFFSYAAFYLRGRPVQSFQDPWESNQGLTS